MNERIKELAEQAKRHANEYVEDEVEFQFHKKVRPVVDSGMYGTNRRRQQ